MVDRGSPGCRLATLALLTGASLAALGADPGGGEEPCERFRFTEVAATAGIDFRHENGATGGKHLPETMGAGAAWLDFDGDGWLDLYLVQSGAYPPDGGISAANRLFRNLGDGRFEAWDRAGVGDRGYGQGVLAADLDGDGLSDLYVANVGTDRLLLNRGDGTFAIGELPEPVAAAIDWSSSAAAADTDGDGDLDLYVVRYIDYDPDAELFCGDVESGERTYCDPSMFVGQRDRFLLNRGGGRFVDATLEAGFGESDGRGLGVVMADLDGDGRVDVYVANDLSLNRLYRNRGDGSFDDLTLLSGAAVNAAGRAEAGMGLGVADFDGDGDPDLAVSNFDVETNTLYRNQGGDFFEDVSESSGFGLPSFNRLGFGLVVADLDRDSWLDVYVANGHIFERPKRENVTYRQPDLLLAGEPGGTFRDSRCDWLEARREVSRAAASADYDGDGDVDLLVTTNDGRPALLRNEADGGRAWLGVELRGRLPNRGAVGAEVTLVGRSGRQKRWVMAGQSYQSTADPRQLFGIGGDEIEALEVRWPDGRRLRLVEPPAGRYLRVVEGDPAGSVGRRAKDADGAALSYR